MSSDAADRTAGALVDTWQALMDVHPTAWIEQSDGITACVTGIPTPGLNGVFCSSLDPDPGQLRRLLAAVRARGVPHLLELRPGTSEAALAVPVENDMVRADDMPLMRLDDAAAFDRAGVSGTELAIRQLEPDDAALHAVTAASGFGEDPDHFVRLMPPEVLVMDGMRAYVGEVDGDVVTTAIGVTLGDHVGVFNVATPSHHRRRGYGAAVTARVVADGSAAGASWAWLQSSPSGHAVYERLGFRTLERWPTWVRV